ncbi:MAG: hypothetical protein ACQESF_06790 [Nanobdellota archaeon]
MYKKGQNTAGGAAAFIAIIGGALLLYLLLLPPSAREELLQDQSSSNGLDENNNNEEDQFFEEMDKKVLSESPGKVSSLRFEEFDHHLPAINLFTRTIGKEKQIGSAKYVKSSVFDKKESKMNFELPENTKNAFLDFKLNPNRNNKGYLNIILNGNKIFGKALEKGRLNEPIAIQDSFLQEENELIFRVSGVGWKFWKTNEYELNNIRIIFDEKDTSRQKSENTFIIDDSEKQNLDNAKLKFNPDCNAATAGVLTVMLNRKIVYQAVPDCGQLNKIDLSSDMINTGKNTISFHAEQGHYLINHINLQTKMEEMTFPVYYFDLDEELFSIYKKDEDDAECGDIDGECPAGCPEYKDKDCCLKKTSKYWCDMAPENENDRCRSVVYESDCQYCPSGYEDNEGDPPEVCEGKCGDDTDNFCPESCSNLYDKDCCFEQSETNYWCNEVPKYGLSYVCKGGIHIDDCDDCPSGYKTEEGSFQCPDKGNTFEEWSKLKSNYDIWLRFKFIDDGKRKAAKIFVNGYQFYMDTNDDEYDRKIDDYVEDGSNAIKIEPDMHSLDIIKMEVEAEKAVN